MSIPSPAAAQIPESRWGTPRISWAFLALALLLVLIQTSWPARRPLEMDEQVTFYLAEGEVPATVFERCLRESATPPLYFWLAKGSARLGAWVDGAMHREWWLRFPAELAMYLAVVQIFWLAERHVGRGTGGPAALLLATHAALLPYASQSRPYTWGLLESLLAFHCLLTLATPTWKKWHVIGFVGANAALLWTHYLFGTILIAQVVAIWLMRNKSGTQAGEHDPLPTRSLLMLFCAVGVAALPLAFGLLRVYDERHALNWVTALPPWYEPLKLFASHPATLLVPVVAATARTVLHRRGGRPPDGPTVDQRQIVLAIAAWLVAPLVMLLLAGVASTPAVAQLRYAIPLAAPAVLLIVIVLGRLGAGRWLPLLTLGFILLDQMPLRLYVALPPRTYASSDWHAAARLLNERATPQDLILVQPGLIETLMVPAWYKDEGFQEYATSRLSRFYLPVPARRRALPLHWVAGDWMQDYQADVVTTVRAKHHVWLVIAADTDLGERVESTALQWMASLGLQTELLRRERDARVYRVEQQTRAGE